MDKEFVLVEVFVSIIGHIRTQFDFSFIFKFHFHCNFAISLNRFLSYTVSAFLLTLLLPVRTKIISIHTGGSPSLHHCYANRMHSVPNIQYTSSFEASKNYEAFIRYNTKFSFSFVIYIHWIIAMISIVNISLFDFTSFLNIYTGISLLFLLFPVSFMDEQFPLFETLALR